MTKKKGRKNSITKTGETTPKKESPPSEELATTTKDTPKHEETTVSEDPTKTEDPTKMEMDSTKPVETTESDHKLDQKDTAESDSKPEQKETEESLEADSEVASSSGPKEIPPSESVDVDEMDVTQEDSASETEAELKKCGETSCRDSEGSKRAAETQEENAYDDVSEPIVSISSGEPGIEELLTDLVDQVVQQSLIGLAESGSLTKGKANGSAKKSAPKSALTLEGGKRTGNEDGEEQMSPPFSRLTHKEKEATIKLCLPGAVELVDVILDQIEDQNVNLNDMDILLDNFKVLIVLERVDKFFLAMQKGCGMVDIRVPEICLKIGKKIFEEISFEEKMSAVEAIFKRREELKIPLQNQSSLYPKFSEELNGVLNNEISSSVAGSEGQVKKIVESISWCFVVSAKSTIYQTFLLAVSDKEAPAVVAQVLRFFTPVSSVIDADSGNPLSLVALNRIFDKEIANSRDEEKEENFFALLLALTRITKSAKKAVLDPTLPLRLMIIPKLQSDSAKVRVSMLKLAARMFRSTTHSIRWVTRTAGTEVWEGGEAVEPTEGAMELLPLIVTLSKVYSLAREGKNFQEAELALKALNGVLLTESKKEKPAKLQASGAEWLDIKLSESRWEFKFLLTSWIHSMGLEADEGCTRKVMNLQVPECLHSRLDEGVKSAHQFEPLDCSGGKENHDEAHCVLSCLLDLASVGDANSMMKLLLGKEPKGYCVGGFVAGRTISGVLSTRLQSSDLSEWRRYLELIEILDPSHPVSLSRGSSLTKSSLEGMMSVIDVGILLEAVTVSLGRNACLEPVAKDEDSADDEPLSWKSELPKSVTDKLVENMAVLLKEEAEKLYQGEWDTIQKKEVDLVPTSSGERRKGGSENLWEKYEKSSIKVATGLEELFRMGCVLAKAHSHCVAGRGKKKATIATPGSITALLSMIELKKDEVNAGFSLEKFGAKPPTRMVSTQLDKVEEAEPRVEQRSGEAESRTEPAQSQIAPSEDVPKMNNGSPPRAVKSEDAMVLSTGPPSRPPVVDKKKLKDKERLDQLRKIWDTPSEKLEKEEADTPSKAAAAAASAALPVPLSHPMQGIGRGTKSGFPGIPAQKQAQFGRPVFADRPGHDRGGPGGAPFEKPQYFETMTSHPLIAGEQSIRGPGSGGRGGRSGDYNDHHDRRYGGHARKRGTEEPQAPFCGNDQTQFPPLGSSGRLDPSPVRDYGTHKFPNSGMNRAPRDGIDRKRGDQVPRSDKMGTMSAVMDHGGFHRGPSEGRYPSSIRDHGQGRVSPPAVFSDSVSNDVRRMYPDHSRGGVGPMREGMRGGGAYGGRNGAPVSAHPSAIVNNQTRVAGYATFYPRNSGYRGDGNMVGRSATFSDRDRGMHRSAASSQERMGDDGRSRLNPQATTFVSQRGPREPSNAVKSLYPDKAQSQERLLKATVDQRTYDVVNRSGTGRRDRNNRSELSSSSSGTANCVQRSSSGRMNAGGEMEGEKWRDGQRQGPPPMSKREWRRNQRPADSVDDSGKAHPQPS